MEVVSGPYEPHENGSSPLYYGWHSSRNNAVSHRAWAGHRLRKINKVAAITHLLLAFTYQQSTLNFQLYFNKIRLRKNANKVNELDFKPTVKYTSLRDVPHGCSLHDVPDHKLFNSLILRYTPSTVRATNRLNVPTALLGTSVVPSLLSLKTHNIFVVINKTTSVYYHMPLSDLILMYIIYIITMYHHVIQI